MLREITILTQEDLKNIEHWAELKFSLSEIATMLMVDVGQLRLAMQTPPSDIAIAYNAGKLKSMVQRRETILKAANKGAEWAIELLDKYEIHQREDELMP